jgi:hypothetical protein
MPAQDSHSSSSDPAGTAAVRRDATATDDTSWWRPPHPKRTALAGFAAFLVGYVLTGVAFAIQMQSVERPDGGSGGLVASVIDQAVGVGGRQVVASSGGELALALRSVGWTFFSAQQIPLFGTASGLGVSASGRVDVLTLAAKAVEIPLTPPLYYLIPPLCLAGGGWWLAQTRDATTMRGAALAGGQLVVGYLPAVVVATLLLRFSATVDAVVASATITAEPVLLRALVFGTGYAVVFGALGGVAAVKSNGE